MIIANQEKNNSAVACRVEKGVSMIRIIVCDDNRLFLETLRANIRKILSAHNVDAVIHIYENADSIPDHSIETTDIFFLDIDFSGNKVNGIDVARKIRSVRPNAIIVFVTNYIEYAPEGYEVQAFRYCLKSEIHHKLEQYILHTISKLKSVQEMLQINVSGEIISIPLADILYIESQEHIAVIHVSKADAKMVKSYKFYSSLSSLEERLYSQGFLRIQKSYLVNMRRLKKYQCNEAVLDNGIVLRVSAKSYAEKKKQYLLWKGCQ